MSGSSWILRAAVAAMVAVWLGAASAVPGQTAAAARRPASVARLACTSSVLQSERTATWQGRMRRVAGARTMQMRFRLEARELDRTGWVPVAGENLGQWQTSQPGVARYVFDKHVENLPAPAAYRVLVEFRWLDRSRRAVRSLKLRSRVCNQPDVRPDLAVTGIAVRDAGDGTSRYRVGVRNTGATAAGASALRVLVGATALPAVAVPRLGAGERARVDVTGPVCPAGATVTAVVDAAGVVAEADETDNTRIRPCS